MVALTASGSPSGTSSADVGGVTPAPWLHLPGIAPLGAVGLEFEEDVLPPTARGGCLDSSADQTVGWSVAAWVWLWDNPTGVARALLFKGAYV